MKKQEFIANFAKSNGITIKQSRQYIDSMLNSIADLLVSGDEISFTDFGTFTTKRREARVGRNPRTNEEIKIAPTTVVSFRVGKDLRQRVSKLKNAKRSVKR